MLLCRGSAVSLRRHARSRETAKLVVVENRHIGKEVVHIDKAVTLHEASMQVGASITKFYWARKLVVLDNTLYLPYCRWGLPTMLTTKPTNRLMERAFH